MIETEIKGAKMIAVFLLYLAFGLADLILTLIAFSWGVKEGNPIMAASIQNGYFIPAKIFLTALIAFGVAFIYKKYPKIAWYILFLMAAVLVYHAWGLSQLTKYPPATPQNSNPPATPAPVGYNVILI